MHLGRIVIFPIKSLDGMVVDEAAITPGGILENDRVFAILTGWSLCEWKAHTAVPPLALLIRRAGERGPPLANRRILANTISSR